MEMIAIVAGLLSMLVSLGVGIRLIRLAGRTQQIPELLIGVSMVMMGFGWSILGTAARQATSLSDPMRAGVMVAAALCAIVGTSCLSLFNWKVFRPGVAWAGVIAAAVTVLLVAVALAQSFGAGWLAFAREERGPWRLVTWIGFVNYVWSALEAWHHQRMMLRRQRLGLVDPVVLDRVRLWSITMSSAVVATLLFGTLQAFGIPINGTPIGLGLTAVISLISSAAMFLAFVPPSAYLASVRRRAAVAAA
jgi:hypothetical protein